MTMPVSADQKVSARCPGPNDRVRFDSADASSRRRIHLQQAKLTQ